MNSKNNNGMWTFVRTFLKENEWKRKSTLGRRIISRTGNSLGILPVARPAGARKGRNSTLHLSYMEPSMPG
jgi:hypothetical protein